MAFAAVPPGGGSTFGRSSHATVLKELPDALFKLRERASLVPHLSNVIMHSKDSLEKADTFVHRGSLPIMFGMLDDCGASELPSGTTCDYYKLSPPRALSVRDDLHDSRYVRECFAV